MSIASSTPAPPPGDQLQTLSSSSSSSTHRPSVPPQAHSPPEAAPHTGEARPSVKLSLNALRLGESFDTIKLDVGLLVWHIGHFPPETNTTTITTTTTTNKSTNPNSNPAQAVSEDDLYAILELSQNIGTNVDRIFSLRNQQKHRHRHHQDPPSSFSPDAAHSTPPPTTTSPQPTTIRGLEPTTTTVTHARQLPTSKRPRRPSCRMCSTDQTPKWRNGPAGPGTLCNVCGLIYAKRRGRVRGRPARQPSLC